MSEQTSPTNLNENLNNSTESTTTNQLRNEESRDMPSAIREDEQSSFSQNRGTFDSPAIQPPEEAEETTLRGTTSKRARKSSNRIGDTAAEFA
jgi:hypothetical protein